MNHRCLVNHIDFRVRLSRDYGHKCFLGCNIVEGFGILSQRRGEVFAVAPLWWAYFEASGSLYDPSPLVPKFLRGICKARTDDAGCSLMITSTENLVLRMVCFFVACRVGRSRSLVGLGQFDCHRRAFIVPLATVTCADLDIVGQYVVIRKAGYHPILSILALRRSVVVDWASYVYV